MILRLALAVVAALWLAGCAANVSGHTIPLGVPSARELVPSVGDLPPGFGLERSEPQTYPAAGFLDAHGVELVKPGTPERGAVSLHAGALRFETPQHAHDAFEAFAKHAGANATRPTGLADEALQESSSFVDPASRNVTSEQLFLRTGVVLWVLMLQTEQKGTPDVDAEALALRLVAKLDA